MSTQELDPKTAFYFNTDTGKVEQGLVSDWTNRMGPYASYDEAAKALQIVAERNRAWDEEDREWDDE